MRKLASEKGVSGNRWIVGSVKIDSGPFIVNRDRSLEIRQKGIDGLTFMQLCRPDPVLPDLYFTQEIALSRHLIPDVDLSACACRGTRAKEVSPFRQTFLYR